MRGMPATRPGSLVSVDAPISLTREEPRFVSRAGYKLDGALGRFSVEVAGRRWLDAGSSTGGFTDRLLQGGAAAVAAVDVGYGQLSWELRNDPRVVVLERTNARNLTTDLLPWAPEGVVADLSFISLRLVLPALVQVAQADADFILLVKPQFEAGREAVSKGGVVRDPKAWLRSLEGVTAGGRALGLGLEAAAVAEPPGPAGNREFFLLLRRGAAGGSDLLGSVVDEAQP